MNPQSELESEFQPNPTLAPARENTECIPFRSNEGEKMNRNCWRKNEKQRAGNTVPTKRLEGNASSFFCLFYIFLGPCGSVLLALKFSALDWLYCPCVFPILTPLPAPHTPCDQPPKLQTQSLLLTLHGLPAGACAVWACSHHVCETRTEHGSQAPILQTHAMPCLFTYITS